jgi:hypothetical protein
MSDRISREEIQAAMEDLVGEGEETVAGAAKGAAGAAGAMAVLTVTLAFLFGRRKGRRSKAVVEVRRI